MEYEIIYSPFAQKQLKKLSPNDAKVIIKTIRKSLLIDPEHNGKYLRAGLKNHLKLKFSKYRVVYKIHKKIITVEIVACGLRKNIYLDVKNYFKNK